VIALAPGGANAWARRGDAFHHLGKLEEAIESFAQAIKRDPQWMWPYNDRGELYLERGDVDLAIADFDNSVRYGLAFSMGWSNRCRAASCRRRSAIARRPSS
jgi:tetratricopeptide (TPR) repeat protein